MKNNPENGLTISDVARLGGLARAAKLSPERRRQIAMKGVKARLRNKKLREKEAEKAAKE